MCITIRTIVRFHLQLELRNGCGVGWKSGDLIQRELVYCLPRLFVLIDMSSFSYLQFSHPVTDRMMVKTEQFTKSNVIQLYRMVLWFQLTGNHSWTKCQYPKFVHSISSKMDTTAGSKPHLVWLNYSGRNFQETRESIQPFLCSKFETGFVCLCLRAHRLHRIEERFLEYWFVGAHSALECDGINCGRNQLVCFGQQKFDTSDSQNYPWSERIQFVAKSFRLTTFLQRTRKTR